MRTYPHGVTSRIATGQPDAEAAGVFYSALFGWQVSAGLATLDGQEVASIAAEPVAGWHTFIAVDDADATAAAAVAGGGTLVAAPADVGEDGRTATLTDPAGAAFRLWQAGRRAGAQLVNTPGAWNFSDLHTPDPAAALAFYTPLFAWRAVELAPGAGTMIQVPGYGDHLAATVDPGIHERQAAAPPGFADVIGGVLTAATPRWHVTFTVADRDAGAATAEQLGATVVSSGETMWTRHALVRDPQGAEFTISQFTPPA
jgi:uncharacterized protein